MVSKVQKAILDTGPLIAFLNKNDHYHDWTVMQFGNITPPLLTCEAVLSEACFLLRHTENGIANIMKLLERRVILIPFRLEEELSTLKILLKKYMNLPMSLADACLVRMAEQITDSVIFTVDSDFRIYRKNKRQLIPVIMPGDVLHSR